MGCGKECYKVQIIIMKLAFFPSIRALLTSIFFAILRGGPPTPGCASATMGVLCREMRALGDINIYAVVDYRAF